MDAFELSDRICRQRRRVSQLCERRQPDAVLREPLNGPVVHRGVSHLERHAKVAGCVGWLRHGGVVSISVERCLKLQERGQLQEYEVFGSQRYAPGQQWMVASSCPLHRTGKARPNRVERGH